MLEKGRILIKDIVVLFGNVKFKIVIVKIYEAFMEMFDTVIIGRLVYYGKVLFFRRDRGVFIGILNGI